MAWYVIATLTSALLAAEFGPQSAATILWLPISEGSSAEVRVVWYNITTLPFCTAAGRVLPSELSVWPTGTALWQPISEGSTEVRMTILQSPKRVP